MGASLTFSAPPSQRKSHRTANTVCAARTNSVREILPRKFSPGWLAPIKTRQRSFVGTHSRMCASEKGQNHATVRVPVITARWNGPVSPQKCSALCLMTAVSCMRFKFPANTRHGFCGSNARSCSIFPSSRGVGAHERTIFLWGNSLVRVVINSTICSGGSSLASAVVKGLI